MYNNMYVTGSSDFQELRILHVCPEHPKFPLLDRTVCRRGAHWSSSRYGRSVTSCTRGQTTDQSFGQLSEQVSILDGNHGVDGGDEAVYLLERNLAGRMKKKS
uniref:Uncharacterized protein n=1 Tax=Cacopsylla melanoneura TaxID=428564 RepID=A0A8D8Z2K9_9HEMI